MKTYSVIALITILTASITAQADPAAPAAAKPNAATPKAARPQPITVFGSIRERPEHYEYFGTKVGDGSYTFMGSLIRVGVTAKNATTEGTFEIAQPSLFGLPDDAVGGPGQGILGQGGNYFAASGHKETGIFLKQASLTFRQPGPAGRSLKLGRFEFLDGNEAAPKDPTITWLKSNRIAQRLIGNFGYTDIQRSYDGGTFTYAQPTVTVTGFAGVPTKGVFDLNANDNISHVKAGYLALTPTPGKKPVDARLFGMYYEDTRPGTTKTDNRAAAVRTADTAAIKLWTYGADYVRVMPSAAGKTDVVLWGAAQTGKWGSLTQQSYAGDAEIGWQPAHCHMNPWLRAGYFYSSGDGNAFDGKHGTFFPMLPTTRIYSRFPFYTESNIRDAFAQLILKPNSKTTLRSDLHFLSLANQYDLWYQGGGAFEPKGNFGFAGLTSSGKSSLGSVLDLSADYKVDKATTWTIYTAAAVPSDVIKKLYNSKTASLTYLEYSHTF
ncbi:MAG TPA: alginate export family protein [Capsulimonadaceae bacterium]|jgi:hypothetical protein